MVCVRDVVAVIEKLARPAYAYEWDNVGLQAGDPAGEVTKVLCCLDVTAEVAREAVEKNCEMIVSHHPLIFRPIKTAAADTAAGEVLSVLYRHGVALYCAHTSLDIAPGGVNDVLCRVLGLSDVRLSGAFEVDGTTAACARVGRLPQPMDAGELCAYLKDKLGVSHLTTGGLKGKTFSTLGLCTGAGEDELFDCPADVFLTGEMKYHTALEAKRLQKPFVLAGHYATEKPVAAALASYLQNEANVLQYPISVICSQVNTDPFDSGEDF